MNRTPEQIRQSLFALTTRGIKYDLERISAAAVALGNPQNSCPSYHVAGTNGKGSTCSYIESILRKAGYRTGLFTSPHLVRFEERFRINGEMVETSEWVEVYHDLERHIADNRLTFFEATMLMAAECFRRRNIDWAVYETGLGGRLDATNILRPRVSIITRVAMDHHEYLGNTLPEVFREKLGIVKETVPLVIADPGEPDLRSMAQTVCMQRKAHCTFISANDAYEIRETSGGTSFIHHGTSFTTRMTGGYQVENALLAISAIARAKTSVSRETMQAGIADAFIPGRFERITAGKKTVVLDVAHNPAAAAELCRTLRRFFPDSSLCFVVGIMADKEYPAMLRSYTAVAQHIILTRPATERAATPEALAADLPSTLYSIVDRVGEAVKCAFRREEAVLCITGSFYTVGEAMLSAGWDVISGND
ncbi:MAG: bifunctional folylpolyglutamate synthase/dihydrofolate synthase [Chitinispirillaceae bacterium]|nr:bifunctional folylpolyglutamate synthase/dihydrofolate synthase [Chitinispirillaceae bacterium]